MNRHPWVVGTVCYSIGFLFSKPSLASPLPTGPTHGGGISISTSGNTMTIHQSVDRGIINWNSFSIAPAYSVIFQQPSRQSATLNRVVGSSASTIGGTLSANGNVFLINPNGIIFSNTAVVNVGGLVASTHDISDSDFLSGSLSNPFLFSGSSSNGIFVQQGAQINTNTENGILAFISRFIQLQSDSYINSPSIAILATPQRASILSDLHSSGILSWQIEPNLIDNSSVYSSAVINTKNIDIAAVGGDYHGFVGIAGGSITAPEGKVGIYGNNATIKFSRGSLSGPFEQINAKNINVEGNVVELEYGLSVNYEQSIPTIKALEDIQIKGTNSIKMENVHLFSESGNVSLFSESGTVGLYNTLIQNVSGYIQIQGNSSSDYGIKLGKSYIEQENGSILIKGTGYGGINIAGTVGIYQKEGSIQLYGKSNSSQPDINLEFYSSSGGFNPFPFKFSKFELEAAGLIILGDNSRINIESAGTLGGVGIEASYGFLSAYTKGDTGFISISSPERSILGSIGLGADNLGNVVVEANTLRLNSASKIVYTTEDNSLDIKESTFIHAHDPVIRVSEWLSSYGDSPYIDGSGTLFIEPLMSNQNVRVALPEEPGTLTVQTEVLDKISTNFEFLYFGNSETGNIDIGQIDRMQNFIFHNGLNTITFTSSFKNYDGELYLFTNGVVEQLADAPIQTSSFNAFGDAIVNLNKAPNLISTVNGVLVRDFNLENHRETTVNLLSANTLKITTNDSSVTPERSIIKISGLIDASDKAILYGYDGIWQEPSASISATILEVKGKTVDLGGLNNTIQTISGSAELGLVIKNVGNLQLGNLGLKVSDGDLILSTLGNLQSGVAPIHVPQGNVVIDVGNWDGTSNLLAKGIGLLQKVANSDPILISGTFSSAAAVTGRPVDFSSSQTINIGTVTSIVPPVVPEDTLDTATVAQVLAPTAKFSTPGQILLQAPITITEDEGILSLYASSGIWQHKDKSSISSYGLEIVSNKPVDIQSPSNHISVLAAKISGSVPTDGIVFYTNSDLSIDRVGDTIGITTSNNNAIIEALGTIRVNKQIDLGNANLYINSQSFIEQKTESAITAGGLAVKSNSYVDLRSNNEFDSLAVQARGATISEKTGYSITSVTSIIGKVIPEDEVDTRTLNGIQVEEDFITRTSNLNIYSDVSVGNTISIISDKVYLAPTTSLTAKGLGLQGKGEVSHYQWEGNLNLQYQAWETPNPPSFSQEFPNETVISQVNTDYVITFAGKLVDEPPIGEQPPVEPPQEPPIGEQPPIEPPQEPPIGEQPPVEPPQEPPIGEQPPVEPPQEPPIAEQPPVESVAEQLSIDISAEEEAVQVPSICTYEYELEKDYFAEACRLTQPEQQEHPDQQQQVVKIIQYDSKE